MSEAHLATSSETFLGDCLDVLKRFEDGSIDAIVTDPPFAITGGLSNGMTSRNDTQFFEHWFSDVAKELIRVIKPEGCMFIWCDWRTVNIIDAAFARASERYIPWWVSQVIVHDREMIGMGSPFRNQLDWIAVVRGKKTKWDDRIPNTTPNIFREYSYYGKHKHHPAEKTVTSAARLIEWATKPNDVVLDPFMGSGTTLIAAASLGRVSIGIEKEQEHYDTACKRLAEFSVKEVDAKAA